MRERNKECSPVLIPLEADGNFKCLVCGSNSLRCILRDGVDYEYAVSGNFNYFECQYCGFITQFPRPSLETIKSFYPSHYHAYQRPAGSLFKFLSSKSIDKRIKRYKELIGTSGTILDVGSGDGEIIEKIQKSGNYDCYGVEFKSDVAESGKNKGLKILYGTIETIHGLREGMFDLIIMNHLIEHIDDPNTTLKRAYRLLKKGGYVCGETPNATCLERAIFKDKWSGFHVPRHLQAFSKNNISAIFRATGFSKVDVKNTFHPGQWALSMQNLYASRFPKTKMVSGKSRIYPICLAMAVPIVIIENTFFLNTGILYFEAQK